ncbi:MAG TPA: UDP-N-acetylmuramoyl-L-alanine--D-glutamate ligase [Sandaracinaceae bacterium]
MVGFAGKNAVVVGAGASGLAAAELLVREGARVVLNDGRTREALGEAAARAEATGAELAFGGHDLAVFDGADLVVVSPGVPPLAVLDEVAARGVEVIGELELAARHVAGTLIAVTGTNGKSTVTTLIGEMMRRTGRPTFVGGNLGVPLSAAVGTPAAAPGGALVVEVSSFQLERVRRFAPDVAVLLNVTPDHLDRYPNFEAYARAKGHVFAPRSAAVIPAGDPLCARLAARAKEVHRFGAPDGEVRSEDGELRDLVTGLSLPRSELPLFGRHNEDNACAAILAARLAGVDETSIVGALREAKGLAHRAVLVRELDGVAYVDDSKATNVGATVAALDGLASPERRVVLIAGGVDKGGSYAPIAERLREVGRAVVLIGQAAPLIEAALAGLTLPIERASSMEDAVRRARSLARPGDLVLLAPACSSFDMFTSYAHRGDAFAEAVRALSPEEPRWA